jgi:hypothetical protein
VKTPAHPRERHGPTLVLAIHGATLPSSLSPGLHFRVQAFAGTNAR